MDEEISKLYGRVMLMEIIFRNIISYPAYSNRPEIGIAMLEGQKRTVLDQIDGMVIEELDRDAAKIAESAMLARAEHFFDEMISDLRRLSKTGQSGEPPSSGGGPPKGTH
jgi:hypothetical protein